MKGKKDPAPNYCAHFTGSYVGQCRAGVVYDLVRDQSRREQLARFPCDRSLNSFTTCDRADFTPVVKLRRRIDVSDKNWKRTIIYTPENGTGEEPVRGQLVGCSDDQATAFIKYRPTPKRQKVIAVPSEQCHFARKKSEDATASHVAGDLPLFDLREVPTSGRRETSEVEIEKVA